MSLYVDIEKKLGAFGLKMKFQAGDGTTALLGASGCGKSMTLKCIAGIEKPDRGKIVLDGVTLFDSEEGINLPPQERNTGFLFQNYALFPDMTVRQNISCGAKRAGKKYGGSLASGRQDVSRQPDSGDCRKYSRRKGGASGSDFDMAARVEEIMKSFDIFHLADKLPSQLSGGEQQRTALARILVSEPDILLLDEPFSALDSHLRFRLEQEVRNVIREFGKTVILVSHNRDEVFRLSDNIAIINNGEIDAAGPKEEVFRNPLTRTAAILTGCRNISPVKACGEGEVLALKWKIRLKTRSGSLNPAYIGIRANEIKVIGEDNVCKIGNQSPEGDLGSVSEVGTGGLNFRGCSENIFRMRVVDSIENPFTYMLMLKPCEPEVNSNKPRDSYKRNNIGTEVDTYDLPEDGNFGQDSGVRYEPLCLEVDKDWWKSCGSEIVTIYIPAESVILMEK